MKNNTESVRFECKVLFINLANKSHYQVLLDTNPPKIGKGAVMNSLKNHHCSLNQAFFFNRIEVVTKGKFFSKHLILIDA